MSLQALLSLDSWILPSRVGEVPETAPTCWMAKQRPSPARKSPPVPVTVLVAVCGAAPTPRIIWLATSCSLVDMEVFSRKGCRNSETQLLLTGEGKRLYPSFPGGRRRPHAVSPDPIPLRPRALPERLFLGHAAQRHDAKHRPGHPGHLRPEHADHGLARALDHHDQRRPGLDAPAR